MADSWLRKDRELTFVPKKGRPVTQCPHCRSERKKRAAHVKCDCGEKTHSKEKCIHLREAEAKAAAASGNTSTSNTSPESDDHHSHELCGIPEESLKEDQHCCCPHGGKCTCATLKQDSPEPRSETPPSKTTNARPRHQLKSHQSEGHLTTFANGHHKPVHRNNNAAHESGMPYKIPRAYSAHGPPNIARRSIDSLASTQSASPVPWQQRQPAPLSAIKIPQDTVNAQSERGSPHSGDSTRHHSPFNMGMSMENNFFPAPETSTSVARNGTIFQDFGYPSTQSGLSIATSSTTPSMSALSMPMSSFGFSNGNGTDYWGNVDWDRLDSTGETQPALTNASSGTISEIDDLPRIDDLTGFDAQFPMDGQSQIPAQILGYDFNSNNDFAGNDNYSASVPTGGLASNRWSMPAYSNQATTNNASSATLNFEMKDGLMHNFATPQNQSLMNSSATSVHSNSPGAQGSDMEFQSKATMLENHDWDNLIPEYGNATGLNMNDAANYGMGGAEQGSASGMQDQTNGNMEGFNNNNSYALQWDDGMSIPADQEFVGGYNFDSNNWANGGFNGSWS